MEKGWGESKVASRNKLKKGGNVAFWEDSKEISNAQVTWFVVILYKSYDLYEQMLFRWLDMTKFSLKVEWRKRKIVHEICLI